MPLPAFKHASEDKYCSDVAEAVGAPFALMDREFIHIGGTHDKVEFCDLFSTGNDLIHVKRYNGSGVLSHLFSQGTVSAEAFRSEPEFRKQALELLPERFRGKVEPPSPSDFRIVFAVVGEAAGPLSLPFFSRVNLRQTVRRLEAYGYRVALAKIAVERSVRSNEEVQLTASAQLHAIACADGHFGTIRSRMKRSVRLSSEASTDERGQVRYGSLARRNDWARVDVGIEERQLCVARSEWLGMSGLRRLVVSGTCR
jgi:hypothetical protein